MHVHLNSIYSPQVSGLYDRSFSWFKWVTEGSGSKWLKQPWYTIKRPRIWDYRWLHSSIPFPAKKKWNLFNPPLWCSFGGRPGTASIHHWPKKSTEHTESGGALALTSREEGQLASKQEVLGLIGQRETPLGHRSQRSVGTLLARRLVCGALMENGRGSWEFSVDLRLQAAVTTRQGSPSNQILALSDSSQSCKFAVSSLSYTFWWVFF